MFGVQVPVFEFFRYRYDWIRDISHKCRLYFSYENRSERMNTRFLNKLDFRTMLALSWECCQAAVYPFNGHMFQWSTIAFFRLRRRNLVDILTNEHVFGEEITYFMVKWSYLAQIGTRFMRTKWKMIQWVNALYVCLYLPCACTLTYIMPPLLLVLLLFLFASVPCASIKPVQHCSVNTIQFTVLCLQFL